MKSIVERGLVGLANAGVLNGGNWFVGHFAAEVLSLAFLLLNKRIEKSAEFKQAYAMLAEIYKQQGKTKEAEYYQSVVSQF